MMMMMTISVYIYIYIHCIHEVSHIVAMTVHRPSEVDSRFAKSRALCTCCFNFSL